MQPLLQIGQPSQRRFSTSNRSSTHGENESQKCTICVFEHDKLPCDPCQYLLTPESLPSKNFFEFFCLQQYRSNFLLDHTLLQQTYKAYQRVLHPDKFSTNTELMDSANQVSAFCSTAFKVLQDDVSRAKYILEEEHGIQALTEGEREKDHELMEWVFEIRMDIEEADDQDELSMMLRQVESDYASKIDEIGRHFENKEFDKVKGELEQTQYLAQMVAEIELKMLQLKEGHHTTN